MKTRYAYIGGSYDPPHVGHLRLFQRVRDMGYTPLIMVNSDSFIRSYKQREPYMTLKDRLKVLRDMDIGDVFTVDRDDQRKTLDSMLCRNDVIVVGTDWLRPEVLDQLQIDEEWLHRSGVGLLFLSRTPHISSTEIRERSGND